MSVCRDLRFSEKKHHSYYKTGQRYCLLVLVFMTMMTTTMSRLFLVAPFIFLARAEYSFESFLKDFGKVYPDPAEYASHETIFYENLASIDRHNAQSDQFGYTLGVNQYSDLVNTEIPLGYVKTYHLDDIAAGRRLMNNVNLESILTTEPVANLPKHVDWRRKGVSTPVRVCTSRLTPCV